MGGECLKTIGEAYQEYEYLEKLRLNLNRNDLGHEDIVELVEGMENLGMLNQAYIQAKKNVKRVDRKDAIRDSLNKLMIKNKKIDL